MRKSFTIATFVVAGAGAVGVGALTMAGSDTLFTITRDMVSSFNGGSALCSGATSITYNGGGSGTGENAMLAGTQTVAPMSRALGANACKGVLDAGIPTTANGLIVALDGLAIIASSTQAGTTACNGTAGGEDAGACTTAAGVPIDNTVGLASHTTVTLPDSSTYTFNKWSDVLRVLFMGKDHSGTVNCNSALRNFLASHWSSVFEAAGCTSGTCTQIEHLFRRDDASGTTDVFSQLLGFGGPSATGGAAVASQIGTWHFGADNFCDSASNAGAAPWNATQPGENGGSEFGVLGTTTTQGGILPRDDQDHDPIRRACQTVRGGGEQVCERGTYLGANAATATAAVSGGAIATVTVNTGGSGYLAPPIVNFIGTFGAGGHGAVATATLTNGAVTAINVSDVGAAYTTAPTVDLTFSPGTLGLLLPIVDTNILGADQYHTNACNGPFVAVHAPNIPVLNARGAIVVQGGNCPNGDNSHVGGDVCQVPADSTGNPNCLATTTPAFRNGADGVATQGVAGGSTAGTTGMNPQSADGRVYNKYVYKQNSDGTWSPASDNSNRPVYGAFYRIHSTLTLPGGSGVPCILPDATHQIGCLAAASPCSLGYAGKDGTNEPGATAMKVNGVPPVTSCVQALGDPVNEYPITRKLYLNSIVGFQSATAAEQALAGCEATGGIFGQAVDFEHFIRLPTTGPNAINGGNAICEDFNEQMLCGDAGANVNGCPAGSAVTGVSVSVACGNGIKEAFEDCDPADPASTAACPNGGAGCSTICRCN